MVFMDPNSLLQPAVNEAVSTIWLLRPDTRLSDRRKTRIPCDERLPSN
jgi:hypothetical protein